MPGDYTFAKTSWYTGTSWGNLFYKIYDSRNYGAAKAQCESDGAVLAIPRSEIQNDFIAYLIPNENIWIGINDIDQEGLFVGVDGSQISWTKWEPYANQPDNRGGGQDGVQILQGTDWQTISNSWDDAAVGYLAKFVCTKFACTCVG